LGVLRSSWILIGRIKAEKTNRPNKLTNTKKRENSTGRFRYLWNCCKLSFWHSSLRFVLCGFYGLRYGFFSNQNAYENVTWNLQRIEKVFPPTNTQNFVCCFRIQKGTKFLEKWAFFLTKSNNNCRKRKWQVLVLLLYFCPNHNCAKNCTKVLLLFLRLSKYANLSLGTRKNKLKNKIFLKYQSLTF